MLVVIGRIQVTDSELVETDTDGAPAVSLPLAHIRSVRVARSLGGAAIDPSTSTSETTDASSRSDRW